MPEATRTLTLLYSNEGAPASYREMDGNSVHAYKLVNARGEVHYVKFHWKSLQARRTSIRNRWRKSRGVTTAT